MTETKPSPSKREKRVGTILVIIGGIMMIAGIVLILSIEPKHLEYLGLSIVGFLLSVIGERLEKGKWSW
jgi:hypothetical protein